MTQAHIKPFVFEWSDLDISCLHMAAHAIVARGGIASAVRVHHLRPETRLVVHAATEVDAKNIVREAGSDVASAVSKLQATMD